MTNYHVYKSWYFDYLRIFKESDSLCQCIYIIHLPSRNVLKVHRDKQVLINDLNYKIIKSYKTKEDLLLDYPELL